VSPVKYELGSYIPEDDILHSDRRENLRSCFLALNVMIAWPRALMQTRLRTDTCPTVVPLTRVQPCFSVTGEP
jgi:hypothetical protein